MRWPDGDDGDSLTASGGWCAPRVPVYSLGEAGPEFRVPRGGVECVTDPVLEPHEGMMVYDASHGVLRVYSGGEWQPVRVKPGSVTIEDDEEWWLPPGSPGLPIPIKKLIGEHHASIPEPRGWPVRSRGIELCRITEVGADGLPLERIEVDGFEYERVWSVTDADWVYA